MELTPGEVYEKMVIRAIVTGNSIFWDEANAYACMHRFNCEEVEGYHSNVERWLRLHGVTKMKEHETAALLLIQSVARRFLVLERLKLQFEMYYRLAQLDNHEHIKRASSLQKVLTCAWGYIQE